MERAILAGTPPADESNIDDRARRFLERVERLAANTGDRETAFNAVFGHRGLYVSAFPTMEDRMAFRDVPLARAKLFTRLWRLRPGGA